MSAWYDYDPDRDAVRERKVEPAQIGYSGPPCPALMGYDPQRARRPVNHTPPVTLAVVQQRPTGKYDLNCTVCGTLFRTNHPDQLTCGSQHCVSVKAERARAVADTTDPDPQPRVRRGPKSPGPLTRPCVTCGKLFTVPWWQRKQLACTFRCGVELRERNRATAEEARRQRADAIYARAAARDTAARADRDDNDQLVDTATDLFNVPDGSAVEPKPCAAAHGDPACEPSSPVNT